MKYFKTIILSGALALLASTAHAATTSTIAIVANTACTPVSATDLAQISVIQNDPTLSYSEEIREELNLRQKLVGKTIACAQQDVQVLKATLATTTVESDSQTLKSQLLGALDNVTNFYNIEITRLNGSGIVGTQTIAKEVLQERTNVFTPLGDQINNFILWSQNQALFDTAQTRMGQTSRAVTFLEAATPNPDLQTAFNAALASFNIAQSQNVAAKSALVQSLPASQSLTLIKQSLDSLATTYQNFSAVSTLIKNILPQ